MVDRVDENEKLSELDLEDEELSELDLDKDDMKSELLLKSELLDLEEEASSEAEYG
ncbi:hypothetical protein J6T66_05685 [bacterium]|nr:hypothetical protein [bacterium]